MAAIKCKVQLSKEELNKKLHKITTIMLQELHNELGIVITRIQSQLDKNGNIEDVLLVYEDRRQENETR